MDAAPANLGSNTNNAGEGNGGDERQPSEEGAGGSRGKDKGKGKMMEAQEEDEEREREERERKALEQRREEVMSQVEAALAAETETVRNTFPDAVGFLRQQIDTYPPAGEDPAPKAFADFQAKRRKAEKHKAEGESSDVDQEEGTSRKHRRVQRRVVDNEMDVDTDMPVRNRSSSWV
ncbi:hypothetical protein B0H13DRAFT_2389286 [Mycena leptocephala]|nr:hypothetical protein B0H13DRAFT_2389286 [Mycena leptocephala]